MARPVITIGGKEVSLEGRPDGGQHTDAPGSRPVVTFAVSPTRPASANRSSCCPPALPLGIAGGILLLGLILLLVLRQLSRHNMT